MWRRLIFEASIIFTQHYFFCNFSPAVMLFRATCTLPVILLAIACLGRVKSGEGLNDVVVARVFQFFLA